MERDVAASAVLGGAVVVDRDLGATTDRYTAVDGDEVRAAMMSAGMSE